MAEVVASMVVGPLLSMVKDKASSYLLDQYKVMQGMEEQHGILKRKLPAILDVITDAEQAATHREGAKAWLQELKKVAYQANEVFDEFKYEALRRQAKKNGHYKELGFHIVKLFPTHNRFVFRNRMGNKLRRVVQAIEVLVVEMNSLGFNFQKQASASSKHWRLTDSIIVDPENIVNRSRDVEKQNIVDRLIEQANTAQLVVLPIVGIGGLGKTTLAQLIYNYPAVKKHFQQQSWVCVSDNFDVYDLARKICQSSEKDSEKVLEELQKKLNGKRYLLVLDDVWNKDRDKWDKLKACLKASGAGSAILVTTRNPAVAGLMGTVEAHDIIALDDQFIKEIIERRAFGLQQIKSHPDMVDKFVKRCAGSPLAAKALGSVLSTKTSEEEWEDVLNKTSICNEETGILPILKLSFDDLPSEMKQCFAFCAVFPKDYEINVEKLIQLWIANGFIQEQKHPETVGKRIFDELASRSFFQDVKIIQVEDYRSVTRHYWRTLCKIHDLMHDVALSTMGKECAMASDETVQTDGESITDQEGSQIGWLPDTARHVFLSCSIRETVLNDSMKKRSPAIKTLLCERYGYNSLQHLSKYSTLQALRLHTSRISFPLEPKHLHHLRYLDLSRSGIRTLPEDLSIMYNLQTLDVSGCYSLCQLPKQMKYMTALRHLYTHGCQCLRSMPRDFRKLISLQTLTSFVAGTGSACSSVGELQKLNLGGLLELRQLENVTEKEAEAVNLRNKKELREVILEWTAGDRVDQAHSDSKVLECLEPHAGLQAIRIHSYGGTTIPSWMETFQYMARVHLFGCKNVQYLCSGCPSLCFPNLKELTLNALLNLERIWWERDGSHSDEPIMFPELEKLLIRDCGKLTGLPGQSTFPKLKDVRIEGCPELRTIAESPKLEAIYFEGSEEEMFLWIARHVTSLTSVDLTSASKETTLLAEDSLRKLVDAKEKMNHDALPLVSMSLIGLTSGAAELCASCVHLQELVIKECDALVHWPEKEFEIMVSLRRLVISQCHSLIGYPEPSSAASSERSQQVLPRLETMVISWCEKLREVFNVPASLRTMVIWGCDELKSIQYGHGWQQGKAASSSEASAPACLEYLNIESCDSLTEIPHLPLSLKKVFIMRCGALRSFEFLSGESPSPVDLRIYSCDTLSSLTMGPQAYPCLDRLTIEGCPAIKKLPACLQEGLDSIRRCSLDAHLKGTSSPPRPTLSKPNTWKYALKKFSG